MPNGFCRLSSIDFVFRYCRANRSQNRQLNMQSMSRKPFRVEINFNDKRTIFFLKLFFWLTSCLLLEKKLERKNRETYGGEKYAILESTTEKKARESLSFCLEGKFCCRTRVLSFSQVMIEFQKAQNKLLFVGWIYRAQK